MTTNVTCQSCGREFHKNGITHHLNRSDCSHPQPSQYQHELLTGVLMGDGTIGLPDHGKYPYFQVKMNNEKFIKWLDRELAPLSTGAKRVKNHSGFEHMTEYIWKLLTRTNPNLRPYADWYNSGQKRFPRSLEMTPTIFKMWYVTDGTVNRTSGNWRNRIQLAVTNEQDRERYLLGLFEPLGLSPKLHGKNLLFNSDDSEFLWDWMGEAPPGFDKKWDRR